MMFGKHKNEDNKPKQKPKTKPTPAYPYVAYDGLNPSDEMDADKLVNGCGMFYNVLPPDKKMSRRYQQMAVKSSAAAYLLLPKEAQKRDDITEIMESHMDAKDPARDLPMEKRIAILKKMQEIEAKKEQKKQKQTDDLVFSQEELEQLKEAINEPLAKDNEVTKSE